ncbi:MAG: glutamate racemase, partial [Pseudomonadales bacterium]
GLPLDIEYLSDNAAFPYGNKPAAELVRRALDVVLTAQQRWQADLLVIACNTASTVALPALREQLDIPVVGVVPAIKTAAALTKTGSFGLLATPGTVARDYTRELIATFAQGQHVFSVGSSELVELAEAHIYGAPLQRERIAAILDAFEAQPGGEHIDTLVLGCTHFPLLRDELQALRPGWLLVDSGPAIATRVKDLLQLEGEALAAGAEAGAQRNAHFTKTNNSESPGLDEFLQQMGFSAARFFAASHYPYAQAEAGQP